MILNYLIIRQNHSKQVSKRQNHSKTSFKTLKDFKMEKLIFEIDRLIP